MAASLPTGRNNTITRASSPATSETLGREDAGASGPLLDSAKWIPTMVERIVREFQPLKIILFGSQARGDTR